MTTGKPVALITGAARGIGEATARKFTAGGYRVVATDVIAASDAPLLAAGPIEDCDYLTCDVAAEGEVADLVKLAVDRHGRIDVLATIAGVVLVKPLDETTWDE